MKRSKRQVRRRDKERNRERRRWKQGLEAALAIQEGLDALAGMPRPTWFYRGVQQFSRQFARAFAEAMDRIRKNFEEGLRQMAAPGAYNGESTLTMKAEDFKRLEAAFAKRNQKRLSGSHYTVRVNPSLARALKRIAYGGRKSEAARRRLGMPTEVARHHRWEARECWGRRFRAGPASLVRGAAAIVRRSGVLGLVERYRRGELAEQQAKIETSSGDAWGPKKVPYVVGKLSVSMDGQELEATDLRYEDVER